MHSISFGAEGNNSVEVVSVKILLKQAYSAHLTKVRSLENELKELRETLFQISKSDKSECSRCKEAWKTLDLCKQEYASVLDEQKKKLESLAQKVILLENRNVSVSESNTTKQDAVSKNNELHLESPTRKLVLTNISTNIGLPVEKFVDVHSNLNKVTKANDKSSDTVETNTNVMLYSSVSPKSKTDIKNHVNQKDFFSSLQSSFLDHSSNDSDTVLVTETLDVLDEIPKKDTNESKTKKESNVPKGKPALSLKDADEGKENIFDGTKSSPEKSSAKRRSPGVSIENEQAVKKCKSICPKETLPGNGKFCEQKVLHQTDPPCAKSKNLDNGLSGKEDPSISSADDLSNFSVGSTFFDVDPSFLEQKSVLNNSKKSKTHNPTEKPKAQIPTIVITHNDDADFQTSLSSASKKGDESGAWKTSKKNLKKSANASGFKTTSKFKMTLEAPSLNFKKPKYKQTRLSKSIFHLSQTSATDSVALSEKGDVHMAKDHSSNTKSGVKEDNINNKVKECSGDSTVKDNSDDRVKENGVNRSKEAISNIRPKDIGNTVKGGNGNTVKGGNGNKVKEVNSNNRAKEDNNRVKEISGNTVKENNGNTQTEKDSQNDSETLAWEDGTLSYSEMERLEGGFFSSKEMERLEGGFFSSKEMERLEGGFFSCKEMEKLKNMTIDMDATFVPHHMLQNFNDSVPDVVGASNTTEGLMEQKDDPMNMCIQDESFSSDFIEDVYEQKSVTEESCANQHTGYQIKQYPEKKLLKPPSSKTEKQKCNSFDRVSSPEMPDYKFKEDPVRGKDKRQQLKGFDCKECEKYYSALGLSDEEKKERLKQCSRHRATYVPPATPANFWELDFPDTQECKERGYVGDTQKVALKSRRRRPLK